MEYPVFVFAETLINTETQRYRLIDFSGSTFDSVPSCSEPTCSAPRSFQNLSINNAGS